MESRPILWLSFLFRFTKCIVQCKKSCSITPKYLIWDDGWIFCPLMRKLKCLVIYSCLDLNITSSDLLVFKDNLLAVIHSTTSFRSLFMYLFIFMSDFSMKSILVLSAKWCTVLNSTTSWMLLINNMKRRGHRTDPCGTPYFSSLLSDCVLLVLVNYILSLTNERNQLLATPFIL